MAFSLGKLEYPPAADPELGVLVSGAVTLHACPVDTSSLGEGEAAIFSGQWATTAEELRELDVAPGFCAVVRALKKPAKKLEISISGAKVSDHMICRYEGKEMKEVSRKRYGSGVRFSYEISSVSLPLNTLIFSIERKGTSVGPVHFESVHFI